MLFLAKMSPRPFGRAAIKAQKEDSLQKNLFSALLLPKSQANKFVNENNINKRERK